MPSPGANWGVLPKRGLTLSRSILRDRHRGANEEDAMAEAQAQRTRTGPRRDEAAGRVSARRLVGGFLRHARKRNAGCSWPASRPPCWKAVTGRRSCCCTAPWRTRPIGWGSSPDLVATHRGDCSRPARPRCLGRDRRGPDRCPARVMAWLGELIEQTCQDATGPGRAVARRRHCGPLRQ